MTEGTVLELGRNALQITLMLTLPLLGVSLIVGLVVGIIQAVTQIHEATIAFVPKILAIFLLMAMLGPWMLQNMISYTSTLLASLPDLAH